MSLEVAKKEDQARCEAYENVLDACQKFPAFEKAGPLVNLDDRITRDNTTLDAPMALSMMKPAASPMLQTTFTGKFRAADFIYSLTFIL